MDSVTFPSPSCLATFTGLACTAIEALFFSILPSSPSLARQMYPPSSSQPMSFTVSWLDTTPSLVLSTWKISISYILEL